MSLRILSRTFKVFRLGNSIIKSQDPKASLCVCQQKFLFSNKPIANIIIEKNPVTGEVTKKKTISIPKITLLSGDRVDVTTLEEAQKLAKRRDLKLVKIVDIDTKTDRPIYKLMSGAEYYEEDLKQRERKKTEKQNSPFKGEKFVSIGHNISEHDLQTYVAKVIKWLSKKYEVRMVINCDNGNMGKAEKIHSFLEHHLKPYGRILEKQQKGPNLKFHVLPPKENKTTDGGDDKKGQNNDST